VLSGGGETNRYVAGTPVQFQRISGHRDGDKTSCPGDALYAQLPELRRRAAALAGPIVPHGQVSLASAARKVPYGADAVFTGTVIRPDSSAGAGEVVALQKRGSDGRWVTLARSTAGSDGSFVVRLPWRRAGAVRANAAGVTSTVTTVELTPTLSTRRAAKRIAAGGAVALSGRVRPATAVSVVLERQGSDGTFRRVRSIRARLSRTTWRASVRLRRPGLYRLTARTSAKDGDGRGRPVYVRATR
jgi:hypothetical protein